jgi:hypothetical protein
MRILLLIILFILNIPLWWLLGKSFFGDWGGFLASIDAMFQRVAWGETANKRFILLLYLIACVSTFAAEYHVVAKFILGINDPWAFN